MTCTLTKGEWHLKHLCVIKATRSHIHAHTSVHTLADDLEVVGIITHKWKPFFPTVRCEAELVLVANSVQVCLCVYVLCVRTYVANRVQVCGCCLLAATQTRLLC